MGTNLKDVIPLTDRPGFTVENPGDPDNYNFVVDGNISGWLPVTKADLKQREIDAADHAAAVAEATDKRARAKKEVLITHAIREQQKALLGKEILEKIESGELSSQEDVAAAVEKI